MIAIEHSSIEHFRDLIATRLGLYFEDAKLGALGEVLRRRVEARGGSAADYLERHVASRAELRAIAVELTVTETYFFRNVEQFHALEEICIPERVAARRGGDLALLSLGCASGEEPYSLAMSVRMRGVNARIEAFDVNPNMLEKAEAASYSSWALRETPSDRASRWFDADGRTFRLAADIKKAVAFEERNLSEARELGRAGAYDIVFCRNVLMYFVPEVARAVVARIARALAPGGYLFLGHAENLRALSHDFHLCHTHGTFYYQRLDQAPVEIAPGSYPLPIEPLTTTWVEAVERATERIRVLAETSHRPKTAPGSPRAPDEPTPARGVELGLALELMKDERFGDGIQTLDVLSNDAARDPDVLLLRAALMTQAGRIDAAERTCTELLAVDELNAGAHYLLALCCESRGDRAGAAEHDRVAAYLDPAFAMPRLHLGLLARRAGDGETARREMAQALLLLEREDASRLLLFGGGFGREALLAICRAELGSEGRA
jgi:chemotaxis protein methyltransferase CheR